MQVFVPNRAVFYSVQWHYLVWTRASIDRLISQESSASPNLVGDRAAHPVCDHYFS